MPIPSLKLRTHRTTVEMDHNSQTKSEKSIAYRTTTSQEQFETVQSFKSIINCILNWLKCVALGTMYFVFMVVLQSGCVNFVHGTVLELN